MQNLFRLLASTFGFTSAQGLTSTNVQDAIDEGYQKSAKLATTNTFTDTAESTSTTTGALQCRGGGAFTKNLVVGGNLILPNYPKVNAFRSTDAVYANNVAVTNTSTRVIYNTERKDTSSAYDNTTGVFTVPAGQGGDYSLQASAVVNFTGSSGLAICYLVAMVNGSIYAPIDRAQQSSVTNLTLGCGGSVELIDLVPGDTVDVRIFVSYSGATITLLGSERCTLSIRKLY